MVGSRFRNPDLARTYERLGNRGTDWFYGGRLAAEIAAAVQDPPLSGRTDLPAPPGSMTIEDLAGYEALRQAPTRMSYRGYDVFGMAPSSSGGTTVGESLNILEESDLGAMRQRDVLHHYLEATALAFADRGVNVGDPAYVDVPTEALLSDEFAADRACLHRPGRGGHQAGAARATSRRRTTASATPRMPGGTSPTPRTCPRPT